MIRGLIRWLRVAAPPRWTPWLILPIGAYETAYLWMTWRGAGPQFTEPALKTRDGLLIFAAVVLGVCRAANFHPLYQHDYRNWLRLTPWSSRMPLPWGPIHLVAQDAVWLGLALLLWHDPQISRLYPPLSFLFAYLVVICGSCWPTGSTVLGYLLAFGLAEVVRQWPAPLAALTTAGWLYLAFWIGLRPMLSRFPWNLPWYWNCRSVQAIADEGKQRTFAWPLDQLQGRESDPVVGGVHGALVSLLAGWWLYCLTSVAAPPLRQFLALFGPWQVAIGCIMGRVGVYLSNYQPPISFWGRFWTLRWIIPRYDHIFVTPVLIFLVARYLPAVLTGWNAPGEVAAATTVSVTLLLGLNMPPSFAHWRLTGFHRIVPGNVNKQEFEKI